MSRRASKHSRLFEELQEQLDEVRNILKSYDFDIEECEIDEHDCVKECGNDLFRIYQLLKELDEISKDE